VLPLDTGERFYIVLSRPIGSPGMKRSLVWPFQTKELFTFAQEARSHALEQGWLLASIRGSLLFMDEAHRALCLDFDGKT
jgi:hypothetical protein